MRKINKLMMSGFFLILAIYVIWSAIHRPRVFVLQSYTNDYSWTRNVDGAIRKVLRYKPYDVKYHYMDTKAHSNRAFKRVAGNLARKQINEWKPDVLIAVDDNAQSLVSICYVDRAKIDKSNPPRVTRKFDARQIFGRCYEDNQQMKIVFSGIGAQPEDYGFSVQPNVTGILERMDVPALRDALLIISRRTGKPSLRVLAPIDDSTSGIYNLESLKRLKAAMAANGITVVPQVIVTFDEWRKMIEDSNKEYDLLLFSNYHTVKCGSQANSKRVSPGDLIAWTEANSSIPGMGAWGFYVGDGGMFSVGVSPFEQGEMAAKMAVDILDNHIQANEVSLKTTRQSIIYMREGSMRYHKLELPRIYEAFARASGNFYECFDRHSRSLEEKVSEDHCRKDILAVKMKKQERQSNAKICQ